MTDDNASASQQQSGQQADGGDGQGSTTAGQGAGQVNGQTFTQADVDRIVTDRLNRLERKYADYGDLKTRAGKLAEMEAAQQTDLERAVTKAAQEAEQKGRATATAELRQQLVGMAIKAEAGGRVKDIDGLIADLNLAKFVDDKGELDAKAIKATVERFAASADARDFDGGARSTAKTSDMNALIRQQAGRR